MSRTGVKCKGTSVAKRHLFGSVLQVLPTTPLYPAVAFILCRSGDLTRIMIIVRDRRMRRRRRMKMSAERYLQ